MLIRELERLENLLQPWREFQRFNQEILGTYPYMRREFPLVNIQRNEEKAVVTAEVPGVDPEHIEINVKGKTLVLEFERKADELKEDETYIRKERWYGRFSRTIELPFSIQTEKVTAKFSKGILRIELPRAEAEMPRKISIAAE